ncbi:signal transduction histidine kinase [Amaricoccus macauensis]|uniref:histidine kinase n=1 Tax=Amaricoccus macauensis TaxID=57001 RepID=A0A840SMK9_9RHOB|nr:HAMP domain-containing sensor histidine kinase [Amaricoccus macauensis]MBB5221498.1 signal transduction histidine kinase [Amaricoccus macauensis]
MKLDSIRLRLVAMGAAAVLGSLAVAAIGLDYLFERHVRRLAIVELSSDLDQLTAGLTQTENGLALVRPPSDGRYRQPLSGRYWQIDTPQGPLTSRSLWDATIAMPEDAPRDGHPHEHLLPGPDGDLLLVLERTVFAPSRFGPEGVRILVALRNGQLETAAHAFVRDLAPYLGLLCLFLTVAGWLQVHVGLRPLSDVGGRIAAIRSGTAARLGDRFPAEVRPLAAEVDALIEAREAETNRARSRAGDLAHGLKTPLQALIGEADGLRASGAGAEADGIEEIAAAMRRHVDRELARARIAASAPTAVSSPTTVIARLMSVIRRTEDGARLDWIIDADPHIRTRIDGDDLTEALGALLENAARHAATRVSVLVLRDGLIAEIRIEDDGPGIPEARLDDLTRRGTRLDMAGPGTGLGLAIAREIAEAAGGGIHLANRHPGLRVILSVPISNLTAS